MSFPSITFFKKPFTSVNAASLSVVFTPFNSCPAGRRIFVFFLSLAWSLLKYEYFVDGPSDDLGQAMIMVWGIRSSIHDSYQNSQDMMQYFDNSIRETRSYIISFLDHHGDHHDEYQL